VEQRLGAESRAADAQHQHVVVGLAQALGERLDLADRGALVHQPVEAVLTGLAATLDLALDLAEPAGQLGKPGAGKAVLPVEAVLEEATVTESDHGISTVSPS